MTTVSFASGIVGYEPSGRTSSGSAVDASGWSMVESQRVGAQAAIIAETPMITIAAAKRFIWVSLAGRQITPILVSRSMTSACVRTKCSRPAKPSAMVFAG